MNGTTALIVHKSGYLTRVHYRITVQQTNGHRHVAWIIMLVHRLKRTGGLCIVHGELRCAHHSFRHIQVFRITEGLGGGIGTEVQVSVSGFECCERAFPSVVAVDSHSSLRLDYISLVRLSTGQRHIDALGGERCVCHPVPSRGYFHRHLSQRRLTTANGHLRIER